MLQQIFHILLISVFCLFWGLPALLYAKKNKQDFLLSQVTPGTFIFLFFSGLILLSIISTWACLFFPVNFQLLLICTAVLLCYFLFFQRKKIVSIFSNINTSTQLSILEISFISICLLIFIVLGSIKTVNSDTHIYHTQIILWYNEHGAVPGIANLFPRLGLGSSWLNTISLFRLPFFRHENFSYLNTTLVIWFFLWLFFKWRNHIKNHRLNGASKILSLFYLLIIFYCLFDWELFRDTANSTNYDFIVTALTIIVISYLIESILFHEIKGIFSLLFIILCIAVIPFKLSGIFILLPLFFYLYKYPNIKYWLVSFMTALIILTPLLIKNYIITGYPLYPLSWSITSPDWQVPEAMTDYLRKYIYVLNRFYNNNELDHTKIPELMNKPWIASWFNGILLQHKIIITASFSSFFVFFFKSSLTINYKKIRTLFLLLLLMAAGWFLTAPSPRFGYGVLLILAFFPVCFYAGNKLPLILQKSILIPAIAICCFYLYKKYPLLIENDNYLLYSENSEKPPYKTINIKGTDFYLPEIINKDWMRKCYSIQVPCICQENKYLEPRSENLKEGFRMNAQPDSAFIRNYHY